MERIFNRFEQGDRSFQRRFGGLGLGLAISKSLAEAHGGTLVAESEGRDHGARFFFTIKTVPAQERADDRPAASSKSSQRSLRILLVDDHPDTMRCPGKIADATRSHSGAQPTTCIRRWKPLSAGNSISSSAMSACLMAVAWNS